MQYACVRWRQSAVGAHQGADVPLNLRHGLAVDALDVADDVVPAQLERTRPGALAQASALRRITSQFGRELNYGAGASGLICGFRFGADGRGLSVGADEAVAWLAGTADATGFVWLHFNLAHAATEKCLRANVALSELFHEALRDGSRSTRVERDDEMQVAVVSDVHYDFAFDRGDGPGPADQHHRWVIGDERGGVPLADHPQGLWIAVAVMVTFTVAAGWIALRRMRNR